ncbi:HTH myb-type domain-containing protein [Psidium guajava]|nr:HTH myb-type domain-containing protein [Psidium guajava]
MSLHEIVKTLLLDLYWFVRSGLPSYPAEDAMDAWRRKPLAKSGRSFFFFGLPCFQESKFKELVFSEREPRSQSLSLDFCSLPVWNENPYAALVETVQLEKLTG